jgi:hypothetical protein
LNEQPFLDMKVQSTPGLMLKQCIGVAPLTYLFNLNLYTFK